ncbi:hypothetical protein RhiJN_06440 [Ceratobasidium sp. AG-Ba]|nr:hypothetical protein RhiJN_06440 [Ceratobasidium sp. AG-Ba]
MADRPPSQPLPSSQSGSSSSVPSTTSITDEQPKVSSSSFNASPSGRLTFVFPPTRKSHPRPVQRNPQDNALTQLPGSELLPSPTASSVEGSSTRRLTFPERPVSGPLKLVTDDALTSLLGPPTNRAPSLRATHNLEDWVASSRQTIISNKNQAEDQPKDQKD